MTKFINISNWNLQHWNKPHKGSRPNDIYENPETGDLFYFKQSKSVFPTEIWSEVIASKIGQLLGLNLLDYNIGYTNQLVGCISKSMVAKNRGEELYHGVDILNDYIPEFKITSKPKCTFQNWESISCNKPIFKDFLFSFIDIIFFDAIVGNTDRHTENWAFIRGFNIGNNVKVKLEIRPLKFLFSLFKFKLAKRTKGQIHLDISQSFKFAPIYDSGSCLGREILNRKIPNLLNNKEGILRYINKGSSEINWENNRLNLFEIVEKLKDDYSKEIFSRINLLSEEGLMDSIYKLVDNIDKNCPSDYSGILLSQERKELIKEILTQRIHRIQKIMKDD